MKEINSFLEVAKALQKNTEDEAEAIKSYTELLQLIMSAVSSAEEEEEQAILQKLILSTQEKIADELNHAHALLEEYTELTGIMPAKE